MTRSGVIFTSLFLLLFAFEGQARTYVCAHFPRVDTLDQVDSLESVVNRDILVLGRYGGTRKKWIKKGTLLKVYVLPTPQDSSDFSSEKSFLSGKEVYRGHFESLDGDLLTLIEFGNKITVDIDHLYQIKVFNEIGARVFGDMVNLTSIVGFTYSGILVVGGAIVSTQDGLWGPQFMLLGALLGGVSYLIHRFALIIRRNKYDLISDWYIVRSF